MAKRFTATEKWDDPWYCELSPINRNFWDFLCDKCDIAGIWQVNMLLVRAYFGNEFKLPDFGDRIIKISPTKWFLKKFIEFQYGKLNPAIRFHATILEVLRKYRLLDTLSDRVLDRCKDKDKDIVVKAVSRKLPTKETTTEQTRERDAFHKFMDRFLDEMLDLKSNGDKIKQNSVNAAYRRYGRAGRDILAMAEGDPELAFQGVRAIGIWLQDKGLSWTLDTAANHYLDWKADPDGFHAKSKKN